MVRTISLREANQGFARYIRDVENGEEYVITRNGKPVARLVSAAGGKGISPVRNAALARTHARMDKGFVLEAGPLDRDALHER